MGPVMKHMNHIDAVSTEDLAHLREKEATYKGSWKKRGGIGAFMMLARKWDRLEGILERGLVGQSNVEVAPYDVLGFMEHQPNSGADGTVLAEVRDLRRYLLLCEAEIVARQQPDALAALHDVVFRPVTSDNVRQFAEQMAAFKEQPHPPIDVTATPLDYRTFEPAAPPAARPGAETAVPWVVSEIELGSIPFPVRNIIYYQRGKLLFLEPSITTEHRNKCLGTGSQLADLALGKYRCVIDSDWYVLRIDECPADWRATWDVLPYEKNHKEWSESSDWQQALYTWIETETKYRIKPAHAAWTNNG
jgi:hypothetical protein